MAKNNYFLIHGFLGSEDIFTNLVSQLKQRPETGNIFTPNLFSPNTIKELSPEHKFTSWAKNFNEYVKSNSSEINIMVGYSMGGRLGIHAFLNEPELWSNCYFASSNPGLIKNSQKIARMAWEDGWCYQLSNKPWGEFLKLWNQQDVFKYSGDITPSEPNFDKSLLKLALKNWSLTKHDIDLNKICNKKLHWLVGEKDPKYQSIFKVLQSSYNCKQVTTVNGAGHRFELDADQFNYSRPGLELI